MDPMASSRAVLGMVALGVGLLTAPGLDGLHAQDSPPILITGSSTVGPITTLAIEGFRSTEQGRKVRFAPVVESGTSAGFRDFCSGKTPISNASRPISQTELKRCTAQGIKFYELPIAFDAITVVVNPANKWAKTISVSELNRLWSRPAQGTIKRWNQVNLDWPGKPIVLHGPGVDSGTFDTFNQAINGGKRNSRSDYISSENDNVLVQGVASNANALGYFGYAYYAANQSRLRALPVEGKNGPVMPSIESVQNGSYSPLSRPIFVYVNAKNLKENPSIRAFLWYYLNNATQLVQKEGSIPLTKSQYLVVKSKMLKQVQGTAFGGKIPVGLTISELLNRNIDQTIKRPEFHQ
ncbi:MAG: PstS family phosphate ABC transporter substrate-binding protein [Synechococcus sp.]|nr:PstS family phosphate ABC transporter substrate-binding protein [Synechococcus sp.]